MFLSPPFKSNIQYATVIGAPYAISTMGWFLSIVVLLVSLFTTVVGSCFLAEIAVTFQGVQTLGDIAFLTSGKKMESITYFCQNSNFLLYSPAALLFVADCFQGIVASEKLSCIDYSIFIVSSFCLLATQMRELSQVKILSYVGLFFIICGMFVQLYVVSTNPLENADVNKDQYKIPYFGIFSIDPIIRMSSLLGAASISWSYVPNFILVELIPALMLREAEEAEAEEEAEEVEEGEEGEEGEEEVEEVEDEDDKDVEGEVVVEGREKKEKAGEKEKIVDYSVVSKTSRGEDEKQRALTAFQKIKKAIYLSAFLTALLFFVYGYLIASFWGTAIMDPLYDSSSWPDGSGWARVVFVLLLIPFYLSYAIDTIPLVRLCQRKWMPNFVDDWSSHSIFIYFLISLPAFTIALLLAVFIGNVYVMLIIMSAFSVPWVNQVLPALYYYNFLTVGLSKDAIHHPLSNIRFDDSITPGLFTRCKEQIEKNHPTLLELEDALEVRGKENENKLKKNEKSLENLLFQIKTILLKKELSSRSTTSTTSSSCEIGDNSLNSLTSSEEILPLSLPFFPVGTDQAGSETSINNEHKFSENKSNVDSDVAQSTFYLLYSVSLTGILTFIIIIIGTVGKIYYPELRGETIIGCDNWILYSSTS